MTEGVKLIFWIAGVHILGLVCVGVLMLPALRDDSAAPQWSDGEADEGWGRRSEAAAVAGPSRRPAASRCRIRCPPVCGCATTTGLATSCRRVSAGRSVSRRRGCRPATADRSRSSTIRRRLRRAIARCRDAGVSKTPSQTFTHRSTRDLARPAGSIRFGSTGRDLQPGFDTPVERQPVADGREVAQESLSLHEPASPTPPGDRVARPARAHARRRAPGTPRRSARGSSASG